MTGAPITTVKTVSLVGVYVDRALAREGFAHFDRTEVEQLATARLKAKGQTTIGSAVSEAIASIIERRGPLGIAQRAGEKVGDGASGPTPLRVADHESHTTDVSAAGPASLSLDPALNPESCAEHLRTVLMTLNSCGQALPSGLRFRIEDIAAMRWRISTAIEQAERETIALKANRRTLEKAMDEVRRLRLGAPA